MEPRFRQAGEKGQVIQRTFGVRWFVAVVCILPVMAGAQSPACLAALTPRTVGRQVPELRASHSMRSRMPSMWWCTTDFKGIHLDP